MAAPKAGDRVRGKALICFLTTCLSVAGAKAQSS